MKPRIQIHLGADTDARATQILAALRGRLNGKAHAENAATARRGIEGDPEVVLDAVVDARGDRDDLWEWLQAQARGPWAGWLRGGSAVRHDCTHDEDNPGPCGNAEVWSL